jgi:predicted nucleotidyltransferase
MLTNETKTEIKNKLLEKFELKRIILFGSQARGTADSKSDVDLLIISSDFTDRYKMMREIRRSLLSLNFAFDIIAITPEEYNRDKNIPGTIARYASKEGTVIYEV